MFSTICCFVSVHVICGMLFSAQQWMRSTTCPLFSVDLFDSSLQTEGSTLHDYRARNVSRVSHTDAGLQLSIEMTYPAAAILCSFSFAVRYANVVSTAKKLLSSILFYRAWLCDSCSLPCLQIFFLTHKAEVFFAIANFTDTTTTPLTALTALTHRQVCVKITLT